MLLFFLLSFLFFFISGLWQKLPALLQGKKVCLIVAFLWNFTCSLLRELELTEILLFSFPFCVDFLRYYQGSFLVGWQEAPEVFGDWGTFDCQVQRFFLPLVFVWQETATHSKMLLFSDSFTHWSPSTEGSSTADCGIVAMLAIKKSKFLNAFFIVLLGVAFVALFLNWNLIFLFLFLQIGWLLGW